MRQIFVTSDFTEKTSQQFRHLSISSSTSTSSDAAAESGSLTESLQPLFTSMKIFGLYFKRSHRVAPEPLSKITFVGKQPSIRSSVRSHALWTYSTGVLILLWVNMARSTSAFVPGEQFGPGMLDKLITLSFFMLCAILQTSSHIACRSGSLDRVIARLEVSSSTVANVRKQMRVRLPLIWTCLISNTVSYIYMTWNVEKFQFILAPFGSYIAIDRLATRIALSAAILVGTFYIGGAWLWTLTMNNAVAKILAKEYNLLTKQFTRAVDADGGFHGDLRAFRRRHQRLGRAVSEIDSFIRIGNVGGFFCHMVNVIAILFSLVFYGLPDIVIGVSYIFMLVGNAAGLVVSIYNGVLVNVAAHKLSRRVHDVDILQLDLNEANELAMLQKKLSGERIGFSILNIVLIEKQTILTLLGLLVTYFLLMIQLSSRKTTRCCPISSEFNDTSTMSSSYLLSSASFQYSSTANINVFEQTATHSFIFNTTS